jgi:aminopeptidase N
MLRKRLGDEAFFNGIRRYYQMFEGKTALSEDFERVMEATAGTDLATFFRQWLYQQGWPEYRVSWEWNAQSKTVEVAVAQVQTTGLFDMPVDIVLRSGDVRSRHSVSVAAEISSFRLPFEESPAAVEIDPDGWLLKSVTVQKRSAPSGRSQNN